MRAPSGQIVTINVAAEEITERKRNEQALHQAREAEATLRSLRETQASLVEAETIGGLGRIVAGAGTGLHIVHNIVTERLGGGIRLDSEPGSGARVQLLLPRVEGGQNPH